MKNGIKSLTLIFFTISIQFGCGDTLVEKKNTANESADLSCKRISKQIIYETRIVSHENEDNDWYENIPAKQRIKFIETILKHIKNSSLHAYSGKIGQPSNREEDKLSVERVFELLKDTTEVNGQSEVVVFNEKKLSQFTFIEEWCFDDVTLTFTKKVKGMAFSKEIYNDEAMFMGYTRMFWVWFEPIEIQFEV